MVTDAARELIAERGYDPAFGARPLKRAIVQEVLEPLSERIIAGDVQPGDRVLVDRTGDRLSFATAQRAAA